MRLKITSYLVLGAVLATGAIVACSSDDGGGNGTTPPQNDGGPGVDTSVPDTSVTETSVPPVDAGVVFTDDEIKAMQLQTPLPAVPADPTNAYADSAAAAVLGQRLYFDKSYSGAIAVAGPLGAVGETGKVACIACHKSKATDDGSNNVSLGTGFGTRNALSIVNSSFYKWTNWGGRFDSQWSLPLAVAENPNIMNSTRLQVAHLLWDKYKADYNAIFPDPLDARLDPADASPFPAAGKPGQADFDNLDPADKTIINRIFANYGKAIAAYVRLNVSRNSAFDRFVPELVATKKSSILADDAKRGLKLFLGKASCVQCHSGPNFADDQFHAIGVPQTGARVPAIDNGRFQDIPALLASGFNTAGAFSDNVNTGKLVGVVANDPANIAQFRTKSLRGILPESAPFMHAGQQATLEQVVQYYATGGEAPDGGTKDAKMKPLGLSGSEVADLVAFLKSLQGEAVLPALLMDTSR